MKKVFVFLIVVCSFSATYSQDLIKEIQNLTLANDSLQRDLKLEREQKATQIFEFQKISTELRNRIIILQADSAEVKKVKAKRKIFDEQLKAKSDSIATLKTIISEKDKQIADVRKEGDKKANEKYQAGKIEALSTVVNSYKNKSFDDLIRYSTKESAQRDLLLIRDDAKVRQTLSDLQIYFSTKELLSKQFNDLQIKNAQTQLNLLKQQSALLKTLKEKISDYKLCSDGLKNAIDKIQEIDRKFTANDNYSQQTKLYDITSELSSYFYNYYFNFIDYPYLSSIVLEIMTRKTKDANADISDLLRKL